MNKQKERTNKHFSATKLSPNCGKCEKALDPVDVKFEINITNIKHN